MSTSGHAASPICLNFLLQKSVFIGVLFFTSDFSFHGSEETSEAAQLQTSAAEDRPLGPSVSDRGEEQLSARSDAASSRRQMQEKTQRGL